MRGTAPCRVERGNDRCDDALRLLKHRPLLRAQHIAAREQLIEWMVKTATGDKRIRAGLPKDWRAGDKTGTGMADAMTREPDRVAG